MLNLWESPRGIRIPATMFRPLLILCIFLTFSLWGEEPFTAKVIKKKVRLRASPALEAPIVRELSQGDMVVVDGEQEAFYQVRPPRDLKLYLFRTFVLEGAVEGNHVNVRIAPDLEAPVVAQLNSGDVVEGSISSLHPKWMEITAPEQVRFFVAKDFVEKIGDEHFLAQHEERYDEVKRLLSEGKGLKKALDNSFEEIDLAIILSPFKLVVEEYPEFSLQQQVAAESIREIEQAYLLKKVAYLEEKTALPPLCEPIEEEMALVADGPTSPPAPQLLASARAYWMEIEKNHYLKWRRDRGGEGDPYVFYKSQSVRSDTLKGVLEPYLRPVKEKPGDFVLLDKESREPIAYLYSTRLNLLDQVGQEVEVKGLHRPNNLFNHPAYFVWEIDHVSTPVVSGLSGP